MAVEDAGPTRRSARPDTQGHGIAQKEDRDSDSECEDETEDPIQVEEIAPAVPIRAHKDRIVATKIRALSGRDQGCQMTTRAIPSKWATEKATGTGIVQMKELTDLVKSLVKAMEEQKQAHANRIETLVAQIETLKTQLADLSTQATDLKEELGRK